MGGQVFTLAIASDTMVILLTTVLLVNSRWNIRAAVIVRGTIAVTVASTTRNKA